MIPTPRRRTAVAYLLTAVLLSTFALPVLAAPPTDAPASPVLAWIAHLFDGPSALDRAVGRDQAAPLIDPDDVTGVSPFGQLEEPDGVEYTPPDDGEAAPYIDPNG